MVQKHGNRSMKTGEWGGSMGLGAQGKDHGNQCMGTRHRDESMGMKA